MAGSVLSGQEGGVGAEGGIVRFFGGGEGGMCFDPGTYFTWLMRYEMIPWEQHFDDDDDDDVISKEEKSILRHTRTKLYAEDETGGNALRVLPFSLYISYANIS